MIRRVGLSSIHVLALLACSAGDGARESYAVRDSAGVRIVASAYPAWRSGGSWSLADEPILEIGAADGPEELQLYRVTGAARLSDGSIAVADEGSSTVKIFGADGSLRARFGRPGDGPGEFRSLASLAALPGDTLVVWDFLRAVVTHVTADGDLAGERRFVLPAGLRALAVHRLRDGRLVVVSRVTPGSPAEMPRGTIMRPSSPLLLLDPESARTDTLGIFPSIETVLMEAGNGGFLLGPPAFHKALHVDLAATSIVLGTGDALEVALLDRAGRTTAVFRGPQQDLGVTEADRAWWRDRLATRGATPEERQMTQSILDALVFPDARAAYSNLLVDATGAIWLQTGRHLVQTAPSPEWTIFSADGVLLGTLRLPERFSPFDVGDDYVLGVWRDELDVEYVRMYGLAR